MTLYDEIGTTYRQTRRTDPGIARALERALGDARSVVNVGAGAGSYEPADRAVLAVEPSAVMAAQRAPERPCVRGSAEALPLFDASVDAALAVLTLHHWADQAEGLSELARVARRRVVLLTYDAEVSACWWLPAAYMPELAAWERACFPPMSALASMLPGEVTVTRVPIARDCEDWMLGSFWAHPERVLDPVARAGTSGFARMPEEVVSRVVSDLRRDLASGAWERAHGALRGEAEHDVGLRIITAELNPRVDDRAPVSQNAPLRT